MASKIKLVQGDTRPQIKCVITDANTGDIVDIAGSSVLLKFRASGSSTVLFNLTGYLQAGYEDADGNVTQALPGQAYDEPGSGGRVAFQFSTGQLNIPAGQYEGEIEVTFPAPNAGIQTVYSPLIFQVRKQF
jgi:hypothetical protein